MDSEGAGDECDRSVGARRHEMPPQSRDSADMPIREDVATEMKRRSAIEHRHDVGETVGYEQIDPATPKRVESTD